MSQVLPPTPSGETLLKKTVALAKALQASPQLRRAVETAIKRMGLPPPLPAGSDAPEKPGHASHPSSAR